VHDVRLRADSGRLPTVPGRSPDGSPSGFDRIVCPPGSTNCEPQPPVPDGDGCGKDLDWWFRDSVLHPRPPLIPPKPKPPLTMAGLPAECRQVLLAP